MKRVDDLVGLMQGIVARDGGADTEAKFLARIVILCVDSLKATAARCNPDTERELMECVIWGREMQRIAIAQYKVARKVREFYGDFYRCDDESVESLYASPTGGGPGGSVPSGYAEGSRLFRRDSFREFREIFFGDGDKFDEGALLRKIPMITRSDSEDAFPGVEKIRTSDPVAVAAYEPATGYASDLVPGSGRGGASGSSVDDLDYARFYGGYNPDRVVVMEPFPVVRNALLVRLLERQKIDVTKAWDSFDSAEETVRGLEENETIDVDLAFLRSIDGAEKIARQARDEQTDITRRYMATRVVASIIGDDNNVHLTDAKRRKFWSGALAHCQKTAEMYRELKGTAARRMDDKVLQAMASMKKTEWVTEKTFHRLINEIFHEVIDFMKLEVGMSDALYTTTAGSVKHAAVLAIDEAVARIDLIASWGESLIRLSRL
jgi:hypothetical protein